jgi:hypothetical protein
MTRYAWLGLVVTAGLCGCTPTNFVAPPAPATKPAEPPRAAVRPPVTANQINTTNAQEKAQAMREEMDRDMERAIEAADSKPEKEKK